MNDENKEIGFEVVEEDDGAEFAAGGEACESCESCESCGGSCEGCSGGCGSAEDLKAQPHPMSTVRRVIGVVSGKGGVGKSMVTSMTAVLMNRRGYHVGVLDADMTGPSIPLTFGLHERAQANNMGILPSRTEKGIDVMSLNLFLDSETDPVVWRGVIVGNTVKQFWTDVIWDDVDYLFVDMPPGTGDVPLTIFQSLPVDGILVVTSPQELVSMIVAKAVNMAKMMNVPILGLVENYAWYECPDCGKKHFIYGKSKLEEAAAEFDLPILARLPIRPDVAALVDEGRIEDAEFPELASVADCLETAAPVERAE